jgi:hypothetical protein
MGASLPNYFQNVKIIFYKNSSFSCQTLSDSVSGNKHDPQHEQHILSQPPQVIEQEKELN